MSKGTKLTGRGKVTRVKTAKRRTTSSTKWLQRQLNDPYVAEAQKRGYRSRAAFKLLELNEKYKFLGKNKRVVDLGAAPGGWCQVAREIMKDSGKIVGLDILPMEPLEGVILLDESDFTLDDAPDKLKAALNGQADVVLSDMAAPTVGHSKTDHLRIMGLAEMAYDFAAEVLAPDGAFICKLFKGGGEQEFQQMLKRDFKTVRHAKPPASRADSSESYIVALGFRRQKES